jgi:hypothetical protein
VLSKIIFGISQLAHFRPLFYTPPPRQEHAATPDTPLVEHPGTSWYSQKYLAMVQAGQASCNFFRPDGTCCFKALLRPRSWMGLNTPLFLVFDVMLHAVSPTRGEAASPPLLRRTTDRKRSYTRYLDVTRPNLQPHAVSSSSIRCPQLHSLGCARR